MQFSIELISKITDLYFLCASIRIPNEKDSLVLKWLKRWQNFTFFVGTFKFRLKKTVQYRNDFKDHRTLHPLWEHSNPKWKRQFSIEIISKMTEPYILCGDIQIPIDRTSHLLLGHSNSTEKDSWVLKWFQRWRTRTSFVVTFKFNWKRQFNLEKIWKITKLYILCGAIQNPTEKDSSLTKWLQRWQNITLFAGTFNFHLKKTVQYWNDYKDDRTLHSLWGHSNSDWKKLFSIKMISKTTELYILCRDIQVSTEKRQFSIEMISKMTEPCIPCGDNQIPTEKSVQHPNDFKDQRTLHSLLGHSNPNWKTQIIIQMITKMTDPDILCWHIEISIERSLHILLGHSNSNWKKTVHYPNDFKDDRTLHRLGDTQIPTEKKNSSVLKWFQRWQTPSFFVGTFKIQL